MRLRIASMIKIVQFHEKPTHKFRRNGLWVYVVADGVIAVADACNLDVKDVWVKNGDKWEKAE